MIDVFRMCMNGLKRHVLCTIINGVTEKDTLAPCTSTILIDIEWQYIMSSLVPSR